MFVCLGHVEDDPGEGRPGTGAWHAEGASGSSRHEPFRFPQEGTGARRGAADDGGVVAEHPTGEAHPGQEERCASNTRTARLTMIVLDASVVVELLTNGALADSIRSDLSGRAESFIVPHLIDVEVVSAIRRLVAGRRIGADRSDRLLAALAALPAERYSHTPLIRRIWELRHNFTAYDATYIALAEAMNAVLYTCDAKLCKGHRARVVLFTPR